MHAHDSCQTKSNKCKDNCKDKCNDGCNDKNSDYEKIKNLKSKNLKAQNILACHIETKNITADSATFSDLTTNSLAVTNLNATTLNGKNLFCDNSFKISGVITPVQYVNGEPVQPINPVGLNTLVLDRLWKLNILANGFTNLDAADTRYKNYLLQNFYDCKPCPNGSNFTPTGCVFKPVQTALFTGSVSGNSGPSGSNNLLIVTQILPVNIINGNPGNSDIGIISVGQRVYPENSETYFVIREQLTGAAGATGTYRVDNSFNSVIDLQSQRMLAIKSNGLEECAAVPLRIYGVETLPYSGINMGVSGMSGMSSSINSCATSVVDAVNYNINIANKLLNTRVAAVYLQVGWIGSNGRVVVQGLSIDTKQFDLSILSFGEQMNNNFLIPDNIKPDLSTGVVQISVYVEDGLEVFIPDAPTVNTTPTPTVNATVISSNMNRALSRSVVATTGKATNYTVSFSSNISSGLRLFYDNNGNFPITPGTKNISLKTVGGGGGGGVGYYVDDRSLGYYFPGGGGGSGYEVIDNIDISSLKEPNYIVVSIGKGGDAGQDGEPTVLTIIDSTGVQFKRIICKGGKGSVTEKGFFSGFTLNGGDGEWGGGGAAGFIGRFSVRSSNLSSGGSKGGQDATQKGAIVCSGNGGAPAGFQGGKGSCSLDYAGGGGGGNGGGNGFKNNNDDPNTIAYIEATNASLNSGAGGGGGFPPSPAGKGANGYVEIMFS